eukprot:TRINITY_DN5634_c0_g1_i1.p1 TRINITY_DN5634_c0_g1~~TRINITY_DN5634_c0_g1_i1.p1  ORF type:complete len:168 (+),score=30.20 TRINITY_DN5634_c0_g1_i1:328-831(+)
MVLFLDGTGSASDFESHQGWIEAEISHMEEACGVVDKTEFLIHRNANNALMEAEDMATVVDQVDLLSSGVYPSLELRQKYHDLAKVMGAADGVTEDDHHRPHWAMTLDYLKSALTKKVEPVVSDADAFKTITAELHEANPSGLSKALVHFASTLPETKPEEAPKDDE